MRPKRKATINKSYNDNIDYSSFEEQKSKKVKRENGVDKTSPNPVVNEKPKEEPKDSKTTGISLNGVNFQPIPTKEDYFSHKINLSNATIDIPTKTLHIPSMKLKLSKGDFIYMVSEPPGEPYYIGKIMAFKHKDDQQQDIRLRTISGPELKNYQFQIQWFYRPRDILKLSNDSRLLFASMHTDTCPLISFRGKIQVKHRDEIDNFDAYKSTANNFYFDKLYDRYMMKFYDVVSTSHLLKLSDEDCKSKNFLIAMNKRFEYIMVEPTITKFLISGFLSNSCTCDQCGQWCSNQDSVNCAECNSFYHMHCLDPPLLRKPSRGFSWHCENCTKRHIQELKAKKMVMLGSDNKSSNIDEIENDQIEQFESSASDDEKDMEKSNVVPKYELQAIEFLANDKLTFQERRLNEEWCMRYLGMNSKLEDVLDLDDRSPYPRSATRLGSKYQCHFIPEFIDHPIMYYDPPNNKKKPKKNEKDKSKSPGVDSEKLVVPKEFENVEIKDYPQWLQPRPKGFIERGTDETSTALWVPRTEDIDEGFQKYDNYVDQCTPKANKLGILEKSPNFMDAVAKFYHQTKGNVEESLEKVNKLTLKSLHQPILKPEEITKFEEGVRKYGSELYPVYQHVGTVPRWMIVRFYYLWKKTPNGKEIWGNFEGRLKKKVKVVHEDKVNLYKEDDDSGYDEDKIQDLDKQCRYCHTNDSIQWFRLTGQDTEEQVNGLCFRCARLWRRYAIVWEDPGELEKKMSKLGRKKLEHEVVKDFDKIVEYVSKKSRSPTPKKEKKVEKKVDKKKDEKEKEKQKLKEEKEKKRLEEEEMLRRQKLEVILNPLSSDYIAPEELNLTLSGEPPTNRIGYLLNFSKYNTVVKTENQNTSPTKTSSCEICKQFSDKVGDFQSCESCGISIHLSCVGAVGKRNKKWLCDCCINDINPNPSLSLNYQCYLCENHGGYMRPVLSNGLWCHWNCALVQSITTRPFKPFGDLIYNLFDIYSIDFFKSQTCGKCNNDGCSMKCINCDKPCHGNCGTLSFSLSNESGIRIGNKLGKLLPVVQCCEKPESDENKQLYDFRTSGKRTSSSRDTVPIIKLYIEDLKTKSFTKTYVDLVRDYYSLSNPIPTYPSTHHKCSMCSTEVSPTWYNTPEICKSCYDNDGPVEYEKPELLEIIKDPLQGQQFGIMNFDDKVNLKYLEI